MVEKAVIKADRRRIWWSIAQNGIVTIFLVGVLFFGFSPWAAVLGLAVGGVFILRKTWAWIQQLRDGDLIVLDEEGITDHSYGLGFIPWSNIRGAELHQVQRKIFPYTVVELDLKNPESYFEETDTLNSKFLEWGDRDYGGFWLNAHHVESSPRELLQLVEEYNKKYS